MEPRIMSHHSMAILRPPTTLRITQMSHAIRPRLRVLPPSTGKSLPPLSRLSVLRCPGGLYLCLNLTTNDDGQQCRLPHSTRFPELLRHSKMWWATQLGRESLGPCTLLLYLTSERIASTAETLRMTAPYDSWIRSRTMSSANI